MRSKRAAIIIGGSVLSCFLLLLLIQTVLAANDQPPQPFQQFEGTVTNGGAPAQDGLEIRVKVKDGETYLALELTSESVKTQGNITSNGTYGLKNQLGEDAFFRVPADPDSTDDKREGAILGEGLFFFVVTDAQRNIEAQAELTDEEGNKSLSIPFDPGRVVLNLAIGIRIPATLIAPIGFTNDSTPLFNWDPPGTGDIVSYQLQVVTGDVFEEPFVIDVGDIVETQILSPVVLPDDTYTWRVIAADAGGNKANSEPQTFVVDIIDPLPPTNLTEVTTGAEPEREFIWSRSVDPVPSPPGTAGDESGVEFYIVVISPGSITQLVDDSTCPGEVCEFTTPELQPGNYTIDVIAVDNASNEGQPSTLDFRAGRRDVVQNLVQLLRLFINEPSFQWSPPEEIPTEGIATYEVGITGDPTSDLSFSPNPPMDRDGRGEDSGRG